MTHRDDTRRDRRAARGLSRRVVLAGAPLATAFAAGCATREEPRDIGSTDRITSQSGLDLIAEFEGWVPRAYNDPVGYCTIGFGHLIQRSPCDDSIPEEFKGEITRERGFELMRGHLVGVETTIKGSVEYATLQHQFDALSSFIYNIGDTNFRNSTLLAKLNVGDLVGVSLEWPRWRFAAGQELPGLVRRREAELDMFFDGARPVQAAAAAVRSGTIDLSPIDIVYGE